MWPLFFTPSNTSLCGGFNANAIKAFHHKVEGYREKGVEIVKVYALGKKAADAVRKAGFDVNADYSMLLDHPAFKPAADIASEIMHLYESKQIDRLI